MTHDDSDKIPHRDDCDRTARVTRVDGNKGDVKLRCLGCQRFAFVASKAPVTGTTRGRWRCPVHVERAVTPQGRGCPECGRERAERPTRRPRR